MPFTHPPQAGTVRLEFSDAEKTILMLLVKGKGSKRHLAEQTVVP